MSERHVLATVSVRIDPVVKKRLEKLAKSTGRSRSFLAAEAINEYLDLNEWQVAGIQKAVASLDRGEGVSHEWVKRGSTPGIARPSDRLLNARRNEHPVVARSNRRPQSLRAHITQDNPSTATEAVLHIRHSIEQLLPHNPPDGGAPGRVPGQVSSSSPRRT